MKHLLLLLACCGLLQGQAIVNGGGSSGGAAAVADITTGLLNDWNFETSLTADDGSEGTVIAWTNTPTLRTDGCAVGDQCVELDGSTEHGSAAITFPTTGDFTFALWAWMDTIGGADIFLAGHNGSDTTGEISLHIGAANELHVWFNGDTTPRLDETKVTVTGAWAHYAVTRDAGVLTAYYNGIAVDTAVADATLAFTTCELLIGTEADSGCASSLGNYLDGRLDEIRRYSRALSETDMLALVALGS